MLLHGLVYAQGVVYIPHNYTILYMYNHMFSTLASSSTINNNSHNITIIHRTNTTKNTKYNSRNGLES